MKRFIKSIRYPITKRQRVLRVAFLWVLLILFFLLLRLIYLRFGVGIPCPFFFVTGLYCPGCGAFRALSALLQGDLWQAVRYNALVVLFMPLLIVLCVRETARYIRAVRPAPLGRSETIVCIAVVAVSVLYAIARNLPFFAMLQPTSLV